MNLDVLWGHPRTVKFYGVNRPIHVPFGTDLLNEFDVSFIPFWIRNSGSTWTAKRVKSLKLWAIHILAGTQDYKETWFKSYIYKGYRIPRLVIFRKLVDAKRGSNQLLVRAILLVLTSYKLVVLNKPSLTSITSTPRSNGNHISDYVSKLSLYVKLPKVPEWALKPALSILTGTKMVTNAGKVISGPFGHLDFSGFIPTKSPRYPLDTMDGILWHVHRMITGKIVPIIDKGKYRNIVVGNIYLQLAFKPLADWLRRWLWKQPEVSSGDQTRMTDYALESLRNKKFLLSIDLSEATDRLSRDLQAELLKSMGVPPQYLKFLDNYYLFDPRQFNNTEEGEVFRFDSRYRTVHYSNGQGMGLYVSFPMLELMHYCILKFSTATTDSSFRVLGDDVLIACNDEKEGKIIFERYSNLIERFGGVINPSKTLMSYEACEGAGALFLKDYSKEVRVPGGPVSILEMYSKGTLLNDSLRKGSKVARAILNHMLSDKYVKRYTYAQRSTSNYELVNRDLSEYTIESLRSLIQEDQDPVEYLYNEEKFYNFWRFPSINKRTTTRYKFICKEKFLERLTDNRILTLMKGVKK